MKRSSPKEALLLQTWRARRTRQERSFGRHAGGRFAIAPRLALLREALEGFALGVAEMLEA